MESRLSFRIKGPRTKTRNIQSCPVSDSERGHFVVFISLFLFPERDPYKRSKMSFSTNTDLTLYDWQGRKTITLEKGEGRRASESETERENKRILGCNVKPKYEILSVLRVVKFRKYDWIVEILSAAWPRPSPFSRVPTTRGKIWLENVHDNDNNWHTSHDLARLWSSW